MSFSKLCLEMVHDLIQCHEIPLEAQKATLPKEKSSLTLGQARSSPSKFFEAYRLQKLCNQSLYLEGAFVYTKNVTLSL